MPSSPARATRRTARPTRIPSPSRSCRTPPTRPGSRSTTSAPTSYPSRRPPRPPARARATGMARTRPRTRTTSPSRTTRDRTAMVTGRITPRTATARTTRARTNNPPGSPRAARPPPPPPPPKTPPTAPEPARARSGGGRRDRPGSGHREVVDGGREARHGERVRAHVPRGLGRLVAEVSEGPGPSLGAAEDDREGKVLGEEVLPLGEPGLLDLGGLDVGPEPQDPPHHAGSLRRSPRHPPSSEHQGESTQCQGEGDQGQVRLRGGQHD